METKTEVKLKVLLIGDEESKRNFVRDCKQAYNLDGMSTFGIDFLKITPKSEKVTYQIWDLAGQERFRYLSSSYFKDCNAIIFIGDYENQKKNNEIHINTTQCATFDFKAFNQSPKEFLDSIEETILKHPNTIKALNQDINKALMVTMDPNSNFKVLPKELKILISQVLNQVTSNNYSFFANPIKPTYVGLPTQKQLQEEKKEEKGLMTQIQDYMSSVFKF